MAAAISAGRNTGSVTMQLLGKGSITFQEQMAEVITFEIFL